jgi:hypothetical protein
MRSYVPACALALLLVLQAMPVSGRQLPTATPPVAGEYVCKVLANGGTSAAPISMEMPSVLGTLELDDGGTYKHASSGGRFHYEAASGKIVFESGPFQGWFVRLETNGVARWLRFGSAVRVPSSRHVNHICVLQK